MDKLTRFNKDGKESYCFIEVKDTLLANVPKSTVKGWLRQLKINCKRCTDEEHRFFKAAMPHLSGAFGVIDQDDVHNLLEYSRHKGVTWKQQAQLPGPGMTIEARTFSTANETTAGTHACNNSKPVDIMTVSCGANSPLIACEPGNILETFDLLESKAVFNSLAEMGGNIDQTNMNSDLTTATSYNTGTCSCSSTSSVGSSPPQSPPPLPPPLPPLPPPPPSTETDSGSCTGQRVYRKRYTLPRESISEQLGKELGGLKQFYTSEINPSRSGCRLTDTTMSKIYERLLCFLGFVRNIRPYEQLTLNLASDVKLLEKYIKHLLESRKLMASTASRHLCALLTVIKYARRHVSDVEKLPEVIAIRNMLRQLAREEQVTRKRKREGFSSKKSTQFLFSHILDVIRQVRDEYYNTAGIASSRHLHDFVLLSLYTRALPGRGKELRTLRLVDRTKCTEPSFQAESVEELNALVFESDGSLTLIETDFKTVKTMGPSKMDLSDDEWLVYFIKVYAGKHRTTLLLGKSHDYFFMNKNGDPFLSSGAISAYLGNLFYRETGIRASTNKMRHAICTYFMSLPESQNQNLRESLASLLKHSVRQQQETYNDQRRQERVGLGRSFLRNQLLDSDLLEGEESDMRAVKDSFRQPEDSDGSGEEGLLPQTGDIAALLDPASTGPEDAVIFVAKVLRYTPDKRRVCLQELEQLEGSSDLYRAKCNSTWWENTQTLSYPIDMVYVSSEKAYQLRTTREQIYNDIMSNT